MSNTIINGMWRPNWKVGCNPIIMAIIDNGKPLKAMLQFTFRIELYVIPI